MYLIFELARLLQDLQVFCRTQFLKNDSLGCANESLAACSPTVLTLDQERYPLEKNPDAGRCKAEFVSTSTSPRPKKAGSRD